MVCNNADLRNCSLAHWVQVTPHDDIDLGQHWLRQWLISWRHQAITWTNIDFMIENVLRHSCERNLICNMHLEVAPVTNGLTNTCIWCCAALCAYGVCLRGPKWWLRHCDNFNWFNDISRFGKSQLRDKEIVTTILLNMQSMEIGLMSNRAEFIS